MKSKHMKDEESFYLDMISNKNGGSSVAYHSKYHRKVTKMEKFLIIILGLILVVQLCILVLMLIYYRVY